MIPQITHIHPIFGVNMSTAARSFSPVRNLDSLLAAVAGFIIIHYLTRHGGIGVSPDSVDYISTAENIHDSGRAFNFTGSALVNFPLGYPLLLSTLMTLTGMDPLAFGPVLDGLLFAMVILLSGMMMEGFAFRSKWYKVAVLSIIVLSPCLLEVYSMVWSETLFILLSLLFIYFCQRHFRAPTLSRLLWPALVAGLACITRYAGIVLIATGGLMILLNGGMKPAKRIGHLFFFGLVAYLLLSINLWRNVHLTGTLTGHREKGLESLWVVLRDFGSVIGGWVFGLGYAVVGWMIMIVLIVSFVRHFEKRRHYFPYEKIATCFSLIYSAFIIFCASVSRFQQLDNRLLSPLFIPLLWGLTAWIPGVVARERFRIWPRWGVIVAAAALFFFIQQTQIKAYRENWEGIRDAGIPGYTEDDWRHSATMDYVRRQKDSLGTAGSLYSNADDAIWFLTGMHSTLLPHRDFSRDVQALLARDHFSVAWFNDGVNPDLVSIAAISRYKKLARVAAFPDGAVYFFIAK
jgi:hypothetical protein